MNDTILITGASSGIGAALAREYAKHGSNLILTARRAEKLKAVSEECKALNPKTETLVAECDVTKPEDLNSAARIGVEKFGKLDVVIANAGFGVSGKVENLTTEDFRRQFETNVFGVLNTIYATLDDLKKSKGRLSIVSSIAGYLDLPNASAYSMSKFAVLTLSRTLSLELAPYGVSCTAICPGFVTSEIQQKDNYGNYRPEQKSQIPKWIEMPAEKAAKKIRRAIQKRKREEVITLHGKVFVFMKRYFPGLMHLFGKLIAKMD